MATETLPNLVADDGIIGKTFGSHIIEYRTILSNSINANAINQSGGAWTGASNNWTWSSRKCDLMSEVNVYGTTIISTSFYDIGLDNRQYAIFQLKPEYINSYGNVRFYYWLKNVFNTTTFAFVETSSIVDGYNGSSYGFGVRPRFLIG